MIEVFKKLFFFMFLLAIMVGCALVALAEAIIKAFVLLILVIILCIPGFFVGIIVRVAIKNKEKWWAVYFLICMLGCIAIIEWYGVFTPPFRPFAFSILSLFSVLVSFLIPSKYIFPEENKKREDAKNIIKEITSA